MNVNNISPKAAAVLADILAGVSSSEIDIMTIVVHANGNALYNFIYTVPGINCATGAKPTTWQYINTTKFIKGDCITFLCIARFGPGFKSLTPVAILERNPAPNNPKIQSKEHSTVSEKPP